MPTETKHRSAGFTLLEVVFALFVIAVGVIATAPLFVFSSQENAANGDLGSVGAAAVRRMEQLRATPYSQLTNGGNLDANVTGYVDTSDPEALVRWTIIDNPSPPAPTKIITVRAVARRRIIGNTKQATLVAVRGG